MDRSNGDRCGHEAASRTDSPASPPPKIPRPMPSPEPDAPYESPRMHSVCANSRRLRPACRVPGARVRRAIPRANSPKARWRLERTRATIAAAFRWSFPSRPAPISLVRQTREAQEASSQYADVRTNESLPPLRRAALEQPRAADLLLALGVEKAGL